MNLLSFEILLRLINIFLHVTRTRRSNSESKFYHFGESAEFGKTAEFVKSCKVEKQIMVYTITGPVVEKNTTKCSIWMEVFLSFLVNLAFFTHGIETTFLTSSIHAGHFITSHHVEWTTTSLVIASAVSSPAFSWLIDEHGRLSGVFLISMIQGVSLIPHFLLSHKDVFFIQVILHVLAGTASGGLFTVLPTYIREISSVPGFCISLMVVMVTAGYLTALVQAEIRLYVLLVLVMTQFLSLLVLVESPGYLVMMKKFEKARTNLSKLKMVAENDHIISKGVSDLEDERERAMEYGKLSVRTVWRNKIWLDAFKIGIVLYTLTVLCGSILFLDQQKALLQLRVTPDPESVLTLGALVAGGVVCVLAVSIVDRKYILTFGLAIMTLATAVLAVYTQVDLKVTSLRWLPYTSLGFLVFGYGMIWGLPTLILVEIFNIRIRAPFLGLINMYAEIIKLIHIHTFQYIEDYIGVYTTFYIFASINLLGVVYALFAVPNTKNKSVKQIEKQLKRTPLPA